MTDKPSARCDLANKRIYVSHDEAVAACIIEGVGPYLCRFCLRWHIGHSSKAKRAQRRLLRQMVRDPGVAPLYDAPEVPV